MISNNKQIQRWHKVEKLSILLCLAAFVVACLVGCKVQKVVVTEYRDRIVHDTTQLVDSIFRDRWHEVVRDGDTVTIHDSVLVYKYKYLDRVVSVVEHDSVPYAVEVVREVAKPLTGWQRFIQGSGYAFLGVLLIIIIAFGVWFFLKIKP